MSEGIALPRGAGGRLGQQEAQRLQPCCRGLAHRLSRNDAWASVDLTSLVQRWVDGALPNDGVALADAVNRTDFRASEYHDVARRPKLDVCYYAAE
ncbi:DNRLRE domain-containing protein [Sorangium sp. So ce1128]